MQLYPDAAARVHVRIFFLYLGNGWTDCTESWCMARGPVAMRFAQDGRFCTNVSESLCQDCGHGLTSCRVRATDGAAVRTSCENGAGAHQGCGAGAGAGATQSHTLCPEPEPEPPPPPLDFVAPVAPTLEASIFQQILEPALNDL